MDDDDSFIDDEPSETHQVGPLNAEEVKAIISKVMKIKPIDLDESDQFKIVILSKHESQLEMMFNGAVDPNNAPLVALQNGWKLLENETVNDRTKKYLIARKNEIIMTPPKNGQR